MVQVIVIEESHHQQLVNHLQKRPEHTDTCQLGNHSERKDHSSIISGFCHMLNTEATGPSTWQNNLFVFMLHCSTDTESSGKPILLCLQK